MMKYYTKFWYKSDSEFEAIREEVVNDPTNPNYIDFTKEKLVIEDHDGYGVAFCRFTHKPAAMCGLYKIPNYDNVGRLMNRNYVFPNFRATNRSQLMDNMYHITELLVKPFMIDSPYDCHILSMANRGERNNFFNTYYKILDKVWPDYWHKIEGYIQTGSGKTNYRSWQNAVTDSPDYTFTTMNHDQWLLLCD